MKANPVLRLAFAVIATLACAGGVQVTHAQIKTFDVSADYSLAANPTGAWRYGYLTALNGFFGQLGAARSFGADNGVEISVWELATFQLPVVAKVTGAGTAVSDGGRFVAPSGTVYFAPGRDGSTQNFGAIRFTVPLMDGGTYRIETAVRSLFDGTRSRDADFHVLKNGQELFGQALGPNSSTGYTNTMVLAAGDIIDFAIGRGPDGLTADTGLKVHAVLVLLSNTGAACVPPPPGLAVWWPLNGNAVDRINGSALQLSGNPAFAAGAVAQGLRLDGSDDDAKALASTNLDVGAGPGLTIEMWINPQNLLTEQALLEWSTTTGPQPGLHIFSSVNAPGTIFANLTDVNVVAHHISSAPGVLIPSVFQHVALTYDRTSGFARLYHNGRQVAQANFGNLRLDTRADLLFGRRLLGGGCCRFMGIMDEVSLYSRALNANEIQALFGSGAAGKCATNPPPSCLPPPPGLAAWWPLNGNLNNQAGGGALQAIGNPIHVPGAVNQGLRFDGINDAAVAAAGTNLDVGAGPGLSIELWVNLLNLNQSQALLEWSTTTGPQPGLHVFANVSGPGSLFANLTDINSVAHHLSSAPGVLTTGVFQHVVLTYDRSSGFARFYRNGTQVAQANFGNLRLDTRPALYFGRRVLGGPAYWFNGIMDEVSLYNRALTTNEIQALFATGAAGKCDTNMPPTVPPLITSHPQSLTVLEGSPATFSVTASGAMPLAYQWSHNGVALSAATNSALTIAAAQLADAGQYRVVVSNTSGSVTSAPALLTVIPLNRPPIGQDLVVTGAEDTDIAVTLIASDPNGDPLTYHITAPSHGALIGVAPALSYRPSPNYYGPDQFTFRVSDGSLTSRVATVSIIVTAVNDAPAAHAEVSPLCILWPDETDYVAISVNNSNALLFFDGSLSSDIEGDALQYFWLADADAIPFAVGVLVTNDFDIGPHAVTLLVNDGQAVGQHTIHFEVITLGDAIAALAARVVEAAIPRNRQSLLASLNAAEASFDRGNITPGINQLEAFQHKVRAQVTPTDPVLGQRLHAAAQKIIDAARSGAFNRVAVPHEAEKKPSPSPRSPRLF